VARRYIQIDFAPPPRADSTRGVFETLLVADGVALEAGRHLERLRASASALYGAEPDVEVASATAGHARARLRIDVVPRAPAPPAVAVELSALGGAGSEPAEVELAVVRVAAGFGAHKLIDRGWLEAIEEAVGEGVAPLLCSRAGALLETTRANVFLLRDGALATPPLDGSILPGVTRGVVLEHARRLGIPAQELPLTQADLDDADVVLLSGSLRRLGRALRGPGRRSEMAAARLAAALAP
jgi:para-aminobenzoate synthetase / 4-amino-4-deoxychorismate lyase